jgi:hypothetical protein
MLKAFVIVLLVVASSSLVAAEPARPPTSAPAPAPAPPQQIYKYIGKNGRVVYTNILDEVPPDQRKGGEVDLSKVALNTSVGNDLNKRLTQEHEKLAASPYCQELKQAAAKNEYEQLWDDHAVGIVCGGTIVFLLLITPTMLRKVHPPEWARVLTKAIPMLLIVGGAMYGMQIANKKAMAVRQQLKPCLKETFDGLNGSPDAATERMGLIEKLKHDIEAAQAMAAARTADLENLANQQ